MLPLVAREIARRLLKKEKSERAFEREKSWISIPRRRKEVNAYLAKYGVCLPSNVQVEWCFADTDFMVVPLHAAYTFIPRSWCWS